MEQALGGMSFQGLLALVSVGIGFLLVLLRWAMIFGMNLNHQAFNVQIVKLVKADNIERAMKLCDVAPRCCYAVALKAALSAGLQRRGGYGPELLAAVRSAFSREMTAQLESLKTPALLGWLGLILLLCGEAYVAAHGLAVPDFVHGVAAVGAAAWLLSMRVSARIKNAADLFPEVAAALASTLERER